MGCNCKSKPNVHTAGIPLDRRIKELADLSKVNDAIEVSVDLRSLHAQDRATQIDVLATGSFGMKFGSYFQQA